MKYIIIIFAIISFGCSSQVDTVWNYSVPDCIDYVELTSFNELFEIKRVNYSKDSCNLAQDTIIYYRDIKYTRNSSKPRINNNFHVEIMDSINPKNYGRKNPGKSMRYWGNSDLTIYTDLLICDSNDVVVLKYNSDDELYFEGTCRDGKVKNGRFYFFDEENILVWIEIWKNGRYYADAFYDTHNNTYKR